MCRRTLSGLDAPHDGAAAGHGVSESPVGSRRTTPQGVYSVEVPSKARHPPRRGASRSAYGGCRALQRGPSSFKQAPTALARLFSPPSHLPTDRNQGVGDRAGLMCAGVQFRQIPKLTLQLRACPTFSKLTLQLRTYPTLTGLHNSINLPNLYI